MRAVLLFLFLLPSLIHAAESRQIECRFLSFGVAENPPSVITISDKGSEITCPLPTTRLSHKVVCLAENNTIAFLSSTDKKPFATATIPAGVHAALLIFVQAPGKSQAVSVQLRVIVIEDSPKNFPDGGAFVVNFCSQDIRFMIGEHKDTLKPAGFHGYALPEERDAFNMAPLIFQFQNGGKWHIANESALRFLPGMRYLIIAYVDPVSKRPRINTYQDFPLPAGPAPSR